MTRVFKDGSRVKLFLDQYEGWRRLYASAGKPPPNEPEWKGERLWLTEGFPYPDWTGYILDRPDSLYRVSNVTIEHRNEPSESPVAVFTDIDDAGKYLVWRVATNLRTDLGLPSLTMQWRSAGLDPRVEQETQGEYSSKFSLRSNPRRYFQLLSAGGIQPENRLLPMSYEELDSVMLDGMPGSYAAQLGLGQSE